MTAPQESAPRPSTHTSVLARLKDTPGGPMIVLRAFLGVTFTYAALQKLTNRFFFNAANPGSIQAQLHASIATSPVGALLRPAAHVPVLVGLIIALAELAVGLGTLVGLFGRFAALGGMVLSLILFLTVSYNTTPYFYGPDIVFLFAWTPLVIAGSGAWSLDEALEKRHLRDLVSAGVSSRTVAPELERRAVLRKATSAVALGTFAILAAGVSAAVGRMFSTAGRATTPASTLPPPSTTAGEGSTTTTTGGVKGTAIGLAKDVPVGSARGFTDPAQGVPAYVVRPSENAFVAFSAVCTHAGCTVGFYQPELQFRCPCHGSIFSAVTGAVVQGPATLSLPGISITDSDGELLVDG